jgi:hypothetical protein
MTKKSKQEVCEFCKKEAILKRGDVKSLSPKGMIVESFLLCPECLEIEAIKPEKAEKAA